MAQAASIEELLKSGAHFGHLTRRWNPKMREFIFMQRNGIHIIDLNKTQALLQESLDEINKVARSGKKVLFVGTKKQAQEIIRNEAQRCDMPYVTHRWLGGMLTNFVTIKRSISRMEEIHAMKTDGTYDNITKKERLMLDREKQKLEDVMGGISKMGRLPGALFVVDIVKENIAVNEALKLNIPIFALVDTNCDPDVPDYIIPCNDDAAKAIQLVASNFADAILEGMAEREAYQEEQLAAESKSGSEEEEEMGEISEADVKTTRRKRSRKTRKTGTEKASGDKPAAKADEKPAGKADVKPVTKSEEKPASKPEEKTAAGADDKPDTKSDKKPAAVTDEKTSQSKPAEDTTAAKADSKAKTDTKPDKDKPDADKSAAKSSDTKPAEDASSAKTSEKSANAKKDDPQAGGKAGKSSDGDAKKSSSDNSEKKTAKSKTTSGSKSKDSADDAVKAADDSKAVGNKKETTEAASDKKAEKKEE